MARNNRYAHTPVGTVVSFRRDGKLYRAEVGLGGRLVGKHVVRERKLHAYGPRVEASRVERTWS